MALVRCRVRVVLECPHRKPEPSSSQSCNLSGESIAVVSRSTLGSLRCIGRWTIAFVLLLGLLGPLAPTGVVAQDAPAGEMAAPEGTPTPESSPEPATTEAPIEPTLTLAPSDTPTQAPPASTATATPSPTAAPTQTVAPDRDAGGTARSAPQQPTPSPSSRRIRTAPRCSVSVSSSITTAATTPSAPENADPLRLEHRGKTGHLVGSRRLRPR